MPLVDPDSLFKEDQRGVSEIIGFILIFAILIISLSINQAQIVPQENAEIEFNHYQDVQNELIEVRSSILMAGQADVSQYSTVKLGTSYPGRLFAINPPAAAGTLETSDAYPITIENDTDSIAVDTRFLQYQPGYNELDAQPIWYENSVLYVDAPEEGGIAVLEEQNLVVDGNTIRITALQNEYYNSKTGRVTLELYPNQKVTADEIPTGDLTITLPTRLTADEYWEQAIGSESVYVDVTNNGYSDGVHELELSIDTSGDGELKLNTVGIQSEPTESGQKQNVGSGGSGGGDNGDEGNDNLLSCSDPQFLSGNTFTLEDNERCEGDVTLGNNGDMNIGKNAEMVGELQITGNGNVEIENGGRVDGNIIVEQNANGQIKNNAEVTGCIDVGNNNINVNPNADVEFCSV